MLHWRSNASAFAELLGSAAASLVVSPWRAQSCVRLPARGRALLTGDLHGHSEIFEAVVSRAQLELSRDHHLVLQEIIHDGALVDGVDFSHRLLGRLAELVLAHPGQVHPILANHEIAQYRGHPIAKAGVHCTVAFDEGLDAAFGEEADLAASAVRAFITAMPLAVVCANGVVVTHSLPNAGAMRHFDARVLERPLVVDDFDPPYGAAYLLTWGRTQTVEQLEALAREWNASAFVVGHAPAPEGVEYRPPNMVVLNTGHDRGRVIELDLATTRPSASQLVDASVAVSALLGQGEKA